MLRSVFIAFSLIILYLPISLPQEPDNPTPVAIGNQAAAIAVLNKNGVDVRINQIQIQRIGSDVKLLGTLEKRGLNAGPFNRTIAVSISQKGQGRTSGPISITLKNGDVLAPFQMGNTPFMSVIANARIPDGYDFEESWFTVPSKTKFDQIFPITISFSTTDSGENSLTFDFEGITP